MWKPEGKVITSDRLGLLDPEEVLYEFEGEALTFVTHDPEEAPLLMHSLCVFDRTSRYVVSAVDHRILQDLKEGRIDILTSLRQPRCWIVDLSDDAKVSSVWQVEFDSIPEYMLPKPGAMLNPALDPIFRLRLIGPGVGPGKTSAGDVRMAAQAAETGLRGLARIALYQKKKSGNVPRDIRHYSDLPYQFSRAASFEIAFGRPSNRLPRFDEEVFDEMGSLLELGLTALRSNGEPATDLKGLDDEQAVQLFEAIKALTPNLRGDVERVEVGGTLVDQVSSSRILTRDDRSRSNQWIKSVSKPLRNEPPFRVAGVIEGADQGTSTFILRQIEPSSIPGLGTSVDEINFGFEDRLFDTVSDAWNSQERVFIVGEKIGTEFMALDIQSAVDEPISKSEHSPPEQPRLHKS